MTGHMAPLYSLGQTIAVMATAGAPTTSALGTPHTHLCEVLQRITIIVLVLTACDLCIQWSYKGGSLCLIPRLAS